MRGLIQPPEVRGPFPGSETSTVSFGSVPLLRAFVEPPLLELVAAPRPGLGGGLLALRVALDFRTRPGSLRLSLLHLPASLDAPLRLFLNRRLLPHGRRLLRRGLDRGGRLWLRRPLRRRLR